MSQYVHTFAEAAEKCFKEKMFMKGDNFKDGIYVKVDADHTLVVVDGNHFHQVSHPLQITRGVFNQKYKVFAVANPEEIAK